MTIYQINEYISNSDVCTDLGDLILVKESFLNKEKAEQKIKEYEKLESVKNEKAKHCSNCPIHNLTKRKFGKNIHLVDAYCPNCEVSFLGNRVYCVNESSWDLQSKDYNLEEVDVVE